MLALFEHSFNFLAISYVMAGVKDCTTANGNALYIHQENAITIGLRTDLPFNILYLRPFVKLLRIEEAFSKQLSNIAQGSHFRWRVTKDDTYIRTDISEIPIIAGYKDGIRNVAQRDAVQFLRDAQLLLHLFALGDFYKKIANGTPG